MPRYTVAQFDRQFPDEAACLGWIFHKRWPHGPTCQSCERKNTYYPVAGRRAYSCSWCGHQVHPMAGTIFHKSPTPLRLWFFAIFLMTASKNGVAAKELQRQLGVTYKTAWRMAHEIRRLMTDPPGKLAGVVEGDETYIGGRRAGKRGRGAAGKTVVVGLVQRKGNVRAKVVPRVTTREVFTHLYRNVEKGATVYTDELAVYNYTQGFGYEHQGEFCLDCYSHLPTEPHSDTCLVGKRAGVQ